MKSVPRMMPIHTRVVAAFFDSGRRNAGTPFEIASTPVSATAPDEKPLSRTKMPSVPPVMLSPMKSGPTVIVEMSCAMKVR